MINKLFYGDNLVALQHLLRSEFKNQINLIYIDPPFFSGQKFSTFVDKWASRQEYLNFLKERLILMRELLTTDGSIYVHLDWHIAHYVKILLDEIFGYENLVNEIIWAYRTGGAPTKEAGFSRKHDIIFLYSKTNNPKFNKLKERVYYEKPFFSPKQDEQGRYYADVILRDVFEDEINLLFNEKILRINVKPVINVSSERLDFDTQKPEGLLEILIMACTSENDIVADFFCGSGTTLAVAEKLGRYWIGCDNSEKAIQLTTCRLQNIENSKDLFEKNNKYGKKAKSFEVIQI